MSDLDKSHGEAAPAGTDCFMSLTDIGWEWDISNRESACPPSRNTCTVKGKAWQVPLGYRLRQRDYTYLFEWQKNYSK